MRPFVFRVGIEASEHGGDARFKQFGGIDWIDVSGFEVGEDGFKERHGLTEGFDLVIDGDEHGCRGKDATGRERDQDQAESSEELGNFLPSDLQGFREFVPGLFDGLVIGLYQRLVFLNHNGIRGT